MVTRPACGMPAAPIEAAVAVMLGEKKKIVWLTDNRYTMGHVAALVRSHVIGLNPSGEQKNKQHKQWTLALKQ